MKNCKALTEPKRIKKNVEESLKPYADALNHSVKRQPPQSDEEQNTTWDNPDGSKFTWYVHWINDSTNQSVSHSVIQSVGRSVGRSVSQHAREPLYGNQPEEVGC